MIVFRRHDFRDMMTIGGRWAVCISYNTAHLLYVKEVVTMIDVTKMNGGSITVNADLIETVEETPDTIITLTTGKKIIVKESRQEVKNLVKSYRSECNSFRID